MLSKFKNFRNSHTHLIGTKGGLACSRQAWGDWEGGRGKGGRGGRSKGVRGAGVEGEGAEGGEGRAKDLRGVPGAQQPRPSSHHPKAVP